ncbi:hypothetical protein MTO96_003157 [Rhipicephalus appendiculatus]
MRLLVARRGEKVTTGETILARPGFEPGSFRSRKSTTVKHRANVTRYAVPGDRSVSDVNNDSEKLWVRLSATTADEVVAAYIT